MDSNFRKIPLMMLIAIVLLGCFYLPPISPPISNPTSDSENTSVVATVNQHFVVYPLTVNAELTKIGLENVITPLPPALVDSENWLQTWLSSPTCSPPCWERIIPGKTTVNEAIGIVSKIDGVEFSWLYLTPHVNSRTIFARWNFDETNWGQVVSGRYTDVIAEIQLFPGDEHNLTINEIINAYGDPSTIVRGECRRGYFSEQCGYALVYEEMGMVLYMEINSRKDKPIEIDPGIQVGSVIMSLPAHIEVFDIAYSEVDFLPWEGYKKYEFPDD